MEPEANHYFNNLNEAFSDQLVEKTEIKIIFLTDYHMKKENVEKLKAWYLSEPVQDVSLVIVGGDFDNLNDQSFSKEAENDESEARISSFLNFLEFFGCKIYYVPGNHDPPTMFSSDDFPSKRRSLTQNSFNSHKMVYKLGTNLSIVGVGGSIPALKKDTKTGDTENLWIGYPYPKDGDMEGDLEEVQRLIDASNGHQILFLSHNGPDASSTAIYEYSEDTIINAGSGSLTKFILKNKDRLLINLHGHVHPAQGMAKIELVPIINGGAFSFGEFCRVHLVYSTDSKRWKMRSCTFLDLTTFH